MKFPCCTDNIQISRPADAVLLAHIINIQCKMVVKFSADADSVTSAKPILAVAVVEEFSVAERFDFGFSNFDFAFDLRPVAIVLHIRTQIDETIFNHIPVGNQIFFDRKTKFHVMLPTRFKTFAVSERL